MVSRALFSERYRRFYFADIQAVVIRRTAGQAVWNALLGSGCGLVLVVAVGLEAFGPALWVALAVLLAGLVANLAAGPTCCCHIRTATSTQRLPPLGRLRGALRFLRALEPLIAEAQGRMDPEQLRRRFQAAREQAPAPRGGYSPLPAGAPGAARRSTARVRHYAGRAHGILCGVLLTETAVMCLVLAFGYSFLMAAGMVSLLAELACAVVAAAKQSRSDVPSGLRKTVWLSIAHVCAVYLLGVLAIPVLAVGTSTIGPEPLVLEFGPWFRSVSIFSTVWTGLAGVFGLYQWTSFRARRRSAGQSPPGPPPETARETLRQAPPPDAPRAEGEGG